MTVFKGYLKILKKNLGMLLMYLVIFFAIAIALQASARKEHLGTFEKTRINIAVADRDQSELSQGLIRYLSTIHNVSEISSEPSVMQEELFYRNTSYIVQIPENFYQTCIEEEEPLSVLDGGREGAVIRVEFTERVACRRFPSTPPRLTSRIDCLFENKSQRLCP